MSIKILSLVFRPAHVRQRPESVHLQLEDEIVMVECGGPERGAAGVKLARDNPESSLALEQMAGPRVQRQVERKHLHLVRLVAYCVFAAFNLFERLTGQYTIRWSSARHRYPKKHELPRQPGK